MRYLRLIGGWWFADRLNEGQVFHGDGRRETAGEDLSVQAEEKLGILFAGWTEGLGMRVEFDSVHDDSIA